MLAIPPSEHAPAHNRRADRDRGSLLQGQRGFCRSEPCSRFHPPNTRLRTINARIATGGRSYSGGAVPAGADPVRDGTQPAASRSSIHLPAVAEAALTKMPQAMSISTMRTGQSLSVARLVRS